MPFDDKSRYDEALRGLAEFIYDMADESGLDERTANEVTAEIQDALRSRLLPVLEAADGASEMCEENDGCYACELRSALDKLLKGGS